MEIKKGMKTKLLLLALLLLPLAGKAQYEVFDDVVYYLDDYTLTARVEGSENKEISGNVDIPETVTYQSHVYSVTSIASYAFRDCTKLTSINIPNSVTSIGGESFSGCTSLTAITIPIGVKGIGDSAFSRCTNLSSIEVAEGNSVFDSRDNCNAIIKTASNTLILGCQNSTVPNSVTNIEYTVFQGCSNLSSVIIGEYVESIGKSAFEYCSSLTSVIIPNNVKTMGEYAFRECSSLSSVIIGDGVKNIERLTFLYCTKLSAVTIGNSVENIKEGAFDHCSNLTSINIPDNVTTIGRDVFQECSNLSAVVIGKSVTSIGEQTFRLCSSLADVYAYTEQVPQSHWSAFSGSNYKHATLHVPATSLEAYKNAERWKDFGSIVALTDNDPKPTGIQGINNGVITAKRYYSIDGKQIAMPQRGLNIIKMNDGTTKKVMMK